MERAARINPIFYLFLESLDFASPSIRTACERPACNILIHTSGNSSPSSKNKRYSGGEYQKSECTLMREKIPGGALPQKNPTRTYIALYPHDSLNTRQGWARNLSCSSSSCKLSPRNVATRQTQTTTRQRGLRSTILIHGTFLLNAIKCGNYVADFLWNEI